MLVLGASFVTRQKATRKIEPALPACSLIVPMYPHKAKAVLHAAQFLTILPALDDTRPSQRFLETKKLSRAAQRRHTVSRAATRAVCCWARKRPCGFARLQAI
jgi:hypothetical protein